MAACMRFVRGLDRFDRSGLDANQMTAPVARIRGTNVTSALQAVEHGGHGPGSHAGGLRQLPGCRLPAQIDQVQAFEVGRVQPESIGDRLAGEDALCGHATNFAPYPFVIWKE